MGNRRPDQLKSSQQALARHQGNFTKAAKELGLTRTALNRRLDKHDI